MFRPVIAWMLLAATALPAEDGYDPTAHPAMVQRRITAYTAPIRTLDLAAETPGRLVAVAVQPGERVAGAQPVVRLDAELAGLAVDAAEAALGARQSDAYSRARDLAYAEREVERAATLLAGGRLSAQANDAILRERDRVAGQAAVDAAQITAAQAELATAKARRARHDLRAPEGWVVVERLREPGAMVAAGEAILRLADVSELLVPVRLDEAELAALRAAPAVGLRFAGAAETVPARMRRVDVTFDPTSRKRLVELVIAGEAAPEASGGLAVELALAVPDGAGVEIPLALVAWRLERPVVRTAAGADLAVVALRRGKDAIVVAADAIPAGTTLVAHPAPSAAR